MKPKILCSSCQAELSWGVKFCTQCGQTVEWPVEISDRNATANNTMCASCGTANLAAAQHCKTCGSPLERGRQGAGQLPKSEKRDKNKKQHPAPPVMAPWKIILGLFAVLALVLIVTEIQKPPTPVRPAVVAASPGESQGANMQALQHLQELEAQVKTNPGDLKLLLDLANQFHDNRFWDKAITSYKQYLDKKPKDGNARVDLGICYKENGDLTSAKREMETVLKNEPDHLNAKFNLGIVALASGDLTSSNEWFRKVVAQEPQSEVGQRAKQLLEQHNPQSFTN